MQGQPVRVKPYVGQPVHYVSLGSADGSYPSVCRAAIVTIAYPDELTAALCVLNPEGAFFNRDVPYDAGDADVRPHQCGGRAYRGGTWHYLGRRDHRLRHSGN